MGLKKGVWIEIPQNENKITTQKGPGPSQLDQPSFLLFPGSNFPEKFKKNGGSLCFSPPLPAYFIPADHTFPPLLRGPTAAGKGQEGATDPKARRQRCH